MPKGSAGPAFSDQVPTKNVQQKAIIARRQVTTTKQSPEMAL